MKRARFIFPLAYLFIVALLFFLPGRSALDWRLFSALFRGAAPPWPEDIVVMDVPRTGADGRFSLIDYRRRVADRMQQLAAGTHGTPRAVVFDIVFGRESEEAERLSAGMRALGARGIRRFATVDVRERAGSGGGFVAAALQQVDGVGHTEFGTRAGVLLYPLQRQSASGATVDALPLRVAADVYGIRDDSGARSAAVRLGARDALRAHLLRATDAADAPRLDGRIVIVGSLDDDAERFDTRSGPELLAWALAARIARVDTLPGAQPLDAPWLALALTVVVPGLAVLVFNSVRRRIATPARNRIAAGVATTAGLLALAAVVATLLALGHLYAQVTLTALGVGVAVALAWVVAFQSELLASLQADLESGKLQTSERYDVFVSYSHEPANAKWVENNLVRPLAQARHADGRPFTVFFDTRNLRLGDFWYRRLALAIAGSRHFVPVYSDDYFSRAFCLHEMTLALARSAQKPDFILPLLRTDTPIPAGYEHIQYIDARTADFASRLVERCKMPA